MNQLIPIENVNAVELFKDETTIKALLADITDAANDFGSDPTTPTGRKEIASQAHKVSRSKVVIDNAGKELTADWARQKKVVDSVRKTARDYLDNLRDEIRRPLTDFEAEEAKLAEAAATKAKMEADELEAYQLNDLLDREAKIEAAEAKMEAERLEIARIATEKREQDEREAYEKRIQAEAAERAKQESEAALQAEKDRYERSERERVEENARIVRQMEQDTLDAERDLKELAERQEQDRLDAIENERIRVAQVAARKQAEQDRLDEIERVKSENVKHQKKVNNTILSALVKGGLDDKAAKKVITLVAHNKIPAMSIRY